MGVRSFVFSATTTMGARNTTPFHDGTSIKDMEGLLWDITQKNDHLALFGQENVWKDSANLMDMKMFTTLLGEYVVNISSNIEDLLELCRHVGTASSDVVRGLLREMKKLGFLKTRLVKHAATAVPSA